MGRGRSQRRAPRRRAPSVARAPRPRRSARPRPGQPVDRRVRRDDARRRGGRVTGSAGSASSVQPAPSSASSDAVGRARPPPARRDRSMSGSVILSASSRDRARPRLGQRCRASRLPARRGTARSALARAVAVDLAADRRPSRIGRASSRPRLPSRNSQQRALDALGVGEDVDRARRVVGLAVGQAGHGGDPLGQRRMRVVRVGLGVAQLGEVALGVLGDRLVGDEAAGSPRRAAGAGRCCRTGTTSSSQ